MSQSYPCGVRIGNGYDVHALKEGLPMRLCGVDIPSEKGFVAHSDGDVAIHALCDALLGAAALGDIGLHFPDSDPRYKGIDSTKLLAEVVAMISGEGEPSGSLRFAPCPGKCPPEGSPSPAATKYEICNVDITIALQAPKLRPYIDTMRETLAGIMNIDKSQVSVKATTTERLGFVGRGEGCEVWATVLIARNDIYQY
ncbi:MAG: 2-C-methyl-D-erythritol 2,4-cyclodiphosphate synthase [Bacteroidales bacterium]|nr:2-C-methyl-D-erythritol 2,4-cyclodiphosphate synthase [Bacteroidales bacterium]